MLNIAFPFSFDGRGRTATSDPDTHVRDLIEQVLFTAPGERVNRPDFGSGLLRLLFSANSPELEAALNYSIRASLQLWVGDLIEVQTLEIVREDSAIFITVKYAVRLTGRAATATFEVTNPVTNDPALTCQNEERRQEVRARPLYGLAAVEVRDPRTLAVTFLGKAPHSHHARGYDLVPANVRVRGGRRVRDVRALGLTLHEQPEGQDDWMEVTLDKSGDFSTYTLEVVGLDARGRPTDAPPEGFDPRYSRLPFSFKVDCPSPFDCAQGTTCPPEVAPEPETTYLAKDYASFRQLVLDRLALIMPDWTERHVPDLGIVLVELLAYVGDYLSYYQDAVATEAYLRTARQRISVRRHARLVDYHVHDGCNARAWVCVSTGADTTLDAAGLAFATGPDAVLPAAAGVLTRLQLATVPVDAYEVFEPLPLTPADGSGPFLPEDVLDWPGLLASLKVISDPVSAYLLHQFAHQTRELLEQYPAGTQPSEALGKAVLADLNRERDDDLLYTPERFKDRITPETRALAEGDPHGLDLRRSNRRLLEDAYRAALASARRIRFIAAHSKILFYTWGNTECCLPRGATSATLLDHWQPSAGAQQQQAPPAPDPPRLLRLRPGDVLVLGEAKGVDTGQEADADPSRRQAVRLTRVTPGVDPLDNTPVAEVEWDEADALTFPLCLSAVVPTPGGSGLPDTCPLITDISVAWGNAVLVDHGETVAPPEPLPAVSSASSPLTCAGAGRPVRPPPQAGYFRPVLAQSPVTFRQPFGADVAKQPAAPLLSQDPRQALPQVTLTEKDNGSLWVPLFDLLSSGPADRSFVVEIDDDGVAHLRFGDGAQGAEPPVGTVFTARYRVGNGTAGNVGAGAITYVILPDGGKPPPALTPTNPMPAAGGTGPEPLEQARQLAPQAYRLQPLERAVTADDYAAIALRHPGVKRAAATLRWTGSWHQVVVVIEPAGGVDADEALLRDVAHFLERFRRIGHEVITEPVRSVPLDVTVTACVLPQYLSGQVEAALRDALSNRRLPGGRLGFFHPDNFALGQPVYHSRLVAVAQGVEGVQWVKVALRRHYAEPDEELFDRPHVLLAVGPLEVARCDNDRNFPENGTLKFVMRGGL